MTKYKYLFKTVKTIVALLCIGAIVFDLLPIGAVKAVNLGSENDSIAAGFRENQSPNFFTTWMMQYTSSNAPTAFDRLNDENLFGENGWARTLYPEARSEMYFVLDWGWDLPDSRTYTGDQQDFIGTDILDPGKFPYEGDAAQRLATLNQKITDLGWKGTGLWIYSQEPEGQRSSTDGKPWNEAFWRARLEESKAAGIALWKIDFGEYFHNSEWHRFITELAQEVYPELLIERSIGGSNGALNGGTGGRERTGFADEAAYMLSYSDLYKTYDVSDHLHTAVSLERIGQILLASYMEEGSAGGWIDSHDMPYMSASLGTTIETLRANRYEVARLVAWQKDYAPAYAAGAYDTKLSGEYFADDWTFLSANEDWTGNPLGNVVQRAPSAIARGIELPTARVDSGDRPYLTASRNPSGAISIATHPRTHERTLDQAVYADVNFPVGDLTGPIGVFGYYRSLTMTFSATIDGKRIYARDILSKNLTDITERVTVEGCSLTIPGTLIETIGISGAREGDPGAPGMYLQIGEGKDYLPAPAINERLAVWDIPNSSFETYDSDINGADYDPLAVNPRPVNFTISDFSAFRLAEGGHSGQYAASHTADRSFSVITSTKKYVLPKGFYTASVWVKTSGLGAGDTARLVALDGLTELASVDILALAEGHDLTEWTKVTLPDFFVHTALTLDITTSGSAGSALLFDDLTLLPVSLEEEDALISNIKVDGLSIQEYRSDRGEYTVPVLLSQEELPVVTVTHREDAEVTITQASFVPGEAVIRAKCGEEEKEYTIRFTVKDSVYLSDLNFSKAISGWGTPTRDLSVEGEAISLQMPDGGTRTFAKGIGVNADSEVTLQIEGSDYSVFEAYVGIQTGKPTVASVEFIVKLDGEIAYRSGRMTSTTPAKRICIDVQGAKEITLMVNCLDTIDWDVANWADARFCVKGSLPLEQLSPISSSETETS